MKKKNKISELLEKQLNELTRLPQLYKASRGDIQAIQDFLSSCQHQIIEEAREEIRKKEKPFETKRPVSVKDMKSTALACRYNFVAGYNQALSDLQDKLKIE